MSKEDAGSSAVSATANKRGHPLSIAHQQTIYDVFLRHRAEGRNKTECVDLTASTTGVSVRSTWKVVNAKETTGEFICPPTKRCRKSIFSTLDEGQLGAIRKHVDEFFVQNEPPTLRKLERAIRANKTLPKMSRETLRKVLKKLGLDFGKKGMLVEKPEFILKRCKYLNNFNKFCRSRRSNPKI